MAVRKTVAEKIREEASLSLTGAEYVRDKLLALTSIGPKSLYEQVYAVKIRVKTLESLAEKVVAKKREKGQHYRAADVTDIVGMRLLCLYAEDLPRVTKALVSFVRFCQSPEIRLIAGDALDDAIDELIIYKSSNTSRIYEAVHRECKNLPLSQKNTKGEEKVKFVEAESDGKSYSSIHFVVNCLSHASGAPNKIPLEVQIRTVFEDTWGEIEHSLQYKGVGSRGKPVPKGIRPFHEQNLKLLAQLKDFLEQSGTLAENIRGGYQAIFESFASRNQNESVPFELSPIYWSVGDSGFGNIREELPETLASSWNEIGESLEEAVLKSHEPIRSESEARSHLKYLDDLSTKIEDFWSDLRGKEGSPGVGPDSDPVYLIGMEIGLLQIWRSKISQYFSINTLDGDIDLLRTALDGYIELEKLARFRADPMLNFRIAAVMNELGLPEHADFFLFRAYENIAADEAAVRGLQPSIITNFLAFTIWQKRAKLHSLAIASGNPRINREDQRRLVGEAMFFVMVARKLLPEKHSPSDDFEKVRLNVFNNLNCFLWELRDLSISENDFMSVLNDIFDDVDDEFRDNWSAFRSGTVPLEEIAEIVIGANSQDPEKKRFTDTLMKYFHLSGDLAQLDMHRRRLDDMIGTATIPIKKEDQNDLFQYSISRTRGREEEYKLAIRLNV
ncbi:MAG: hypothetical protein AAFN09_06585 [Pseudomonadota bacterium]